MHHVGHLPRNTHCKSAPTKYTNQHQPNTQISTDQIHKSAPTKYTDYTKLYLKPETSAFRVAKTAYSSGTYLLAKVPSSLIRNTDWCIAPSCAVQWEETTGQRRLMITQYRVTDLKPHPIRKKTYCTVCQCVGTVASQISGSHILSFLWALGRNQPHIQRTPWRLTLAVKRPGREVLPRLHLAAKLRISKLKLSSHYAPSWNYRDKFTLQNIMWLWWIR